MQVGASLETSIIEWDLSPLTPSQRSAYSNHIVNVFILVYIHLPGMTYNNKRRRIGIKVCDVS